MSNSIFLQKCRTLTKHFYTLLLLGILLGYSNGVFGQVSNLLTQNFDSTTWNATNYPNWTSSPGNPSFSYTNSATLKCTSTTATPRRQVTSTTNIITTPSLTPVESKQVITVKFDYKLLDGTVATALLISGDLSLLTFTVEYKVGTTGTWKTFNTVTPITSLSCTTVYLTKTLPSDTEPLSSSTNIQFRWVVTNNTGTSVYWYLDNVLITQNNSPDCTTVTSPADAATGVGITPTLTWTASNGSTGYYIDLGTTPGGIDVLSNQNAGNNTTYTLTSNLAYSTTYYVRIKPSNANGISSGCTITSFTTQAAPPPVPNCTELNSPSNTSTNLAITSNLKWAPASGSPATLGYKLKIGTTIGGNEFLQETTDISSNLTFDTPNNLWIYNPPTDFAYATKYYVTIIPYNANGDKTGCTETTFTTMPAPQSVPYLQDFENTTEEIFNNASGSVNQFVIGTATYNGVSGKSLYISSDNGTSNTYINTASYSSSSVTVDLTGATYADLIFDWKCVGDGTGDYGEVYINTGNGTETRISDPTELKNNSSWLKKRINLNTYCNSVVTIVFRWVNDAGAKNDPPLAIDNVKVLPYVIYENGAWSNGGVPTNLINAVLNADLTLGDHMETKDLTINTGKTLTVPDNKNLTVNGNLTNNGKLVFKSNSSGDGSFGPYTGAAAAGTGSVDVERYIGARRAWRMLTAPLKGSTANTVFANWQNNGTEIASTGVNLWGPGKTIDSDGMHASAQYNILKYPTTAPIVWTGVSSTKTQELFNSTSNNAFAVFVTGPYTTQPSYISPASGAAATTLKATGNLITGDQTYTISKTIHTLIGNPYASPLNPQAILADAANSTNFLQLWAYNPLQGTYGGYNAYTKDTGWGNIEPGTGYSNGPITMIESGSAFFVKIPKLSSTSSATFTIKESHKYTLSPAKRTTTWVAQVRAVLYKNNNSVWQNEDAVVAAFSPTGDNALTAYDTEKMFKDGENLAILQSSTSLTIEHRNIAEATDEVSLKLSSGVNAANYKLKLFTVNYEGLPPYLYDKLTKTYTKIPTDGKVTEYPFSLTDAVAEAQRFTIVFKTDETLDAPEFALKQISLYPNPAHDMVTLVIPDSITSLNYTLYTILGQKVKEGSCTSTKNTIDISRLAKGLYHVELRDQTTKVTKSLLIK